MHKIARIAPMLEEQIKSDVASVDQVFTGPIAGTALLLLDQQAALALTQLMTDERGDGKELDSNAREIITEVGNILLNACLGVFGNLLKSPSISPSPTAQVDGVAEVMDSVGSRPGNTSTMG